MPGRIEDWKRAEDALTNTLNRMNVPFKYMPGEAAFYGPKIDVKLVDAIGRPWQLTTVQFDFNLPRRFELEYVGEDGARHQPLMVHRALFGLGRALFWRAHRALRGRVSGVARAGAGGCAAVEREIQGVRGKSHAADLKNAGFRVHLDDRNEKLQAKIRDAQMQKIPYMLVIGGKEAEAGTVSVRHRTKGDLGPRPLDQFIADLRQEVDSRAVQ